MNQSYKVKIAREVLLFFSSLVVVGLIWFFFVTFNYVQKQRIKNIQQAITESNYTTDSLKSTFPIYKPFEEIINGTLPDDYLNQLKWEKYRVPSTDELQGTEQEKERASNIYLLYMLLRASDYQFHNNPSFPEYDIKNFKNQTIKELEGKPSNQQTLNEIYSFLKAHNYLSCKFEEFRFSLDALQPPPDYNIWLSYSNEMTSQNNLKRELEIIRNKLFSVPELKAITKWVIFLLVAIVYPLRFIILLISWSITTLKHK